MLILEIEILLGFSLLGLSLYAVSYLGRKKARLPVCSCYANGKSATRLSSTLHSCYTDESISFYICQCQVCGGVTGHPLPQFNHFMSHADSAEIDQLMDKFYSSMQTPL